MPRSSSVAFQGSLCGWMESWQSAGPRLRHLRIVSVETLYRLASTPVGSRDRAISARTAGVVRALGWIVGIRTSSAEQAWHAAQSARRRPQPPNAPDPNNAATKQLGHFGSGMRCRLGCTFVLLPQQPSCALQTMHNARALRLRHAEQARAMACDEPF